MKRLPRSKLYDTLDSVQERIFLKMLIFLKSTDKKITQLKRVKRLQNMNVKMLPAEVVCCICGTFSGNLGVIEVHGRF